MPEERGATNEVKGSTSYNIGTVLEDGRESLLVGPGSFGNLIGEHTYERQAMTANNNGKQGSVSQRRTVLNVGGVGHGTQRCTKDGVIPTALRRSDGTMVGGTFTAPIVEGATTPALYGLQSMIKNRAILDCAGKKLYHMGPGEFQIICPPGTDI